MSIILLWISAEMFIFTHPVCVSLISVCLVIQNTKRVDSSWPTFDNHFK